MSRFTRRHFITARLARDPGPSDSSRACEAVIDAACLALNRIVCRSCAESCEAEAIRFVPTAGGVSTPRIDPDACNGCGDCLRACAVGAIAVRARIPGVAA